MLIVEVVWKAPCKTSDSSKATCSGMVQVISIAQQHQGFRDLHANLDCGSHSKQNSRNWTSAFDLLRSPTKQLQAVLYR